MSLYNLLVSVVPHNKGELVSQAAGEAGSFGGTILSGRGISKNKIAAALGIESSRDIVFILTDSEHTQAISDAIKNVKTIDGILLSIKADNLIKAGKISGSEGDEQMNNDVSEELITVILNKGYADDAMAAARKAGAGGGTVVNARGTAREDDAKFFGMHIVPEKEMLMIVVKAEIKNAVLEALRTLPCLQQAGSGIVFSSAVDSFSLLGTKQ